jgi:hypothetical protein
MTKLNNYDLLDPSRELRDVAVGLSTPTIFDKWSELDPVLAAARINAVHSGLIGTTEMLDPYRWLVALNTVMP